MSRFLYILLIVFFVRGVSAQSSLNTNSLKLPELSTSSSTSIKSHNEFELQQSQYLSTGLQEYRSDAAKDNSSSILKLDDEFNKGVFTAKLKGKDEYSATENWNYGDVFEAYSGTKTENASFAMGRKLETWSAWDEEWQQGAFQPRYMENRMRMDQAGLTGFFFGAKSDHFSATLAVLPLFIPDFGPHFYVQNDRFTSKNPWFHPPTDRFEARAGTGDIHYQLEHPPTSDVVRYGGAATKFEYKNGGYLARLSGAYKPMPQFLLGFKGKLVLTQEEDHFDLNVVARVAYDRVVNLDNLYTHGPWAFSGSVAYSNPDDPNTPADWTSQEVRSATVFSGSVERRLGDEGPRATSVRFGFLKVHGGDAQDHGPFSGTTTLFERRFQFYEAYSLSVHRDFHVSMAHPLETETRMIYDRMQGGGMVALNSGMRLSDRLRAEIEADFIGLLTSTATITDGFIDEYRANNRFSLGMSYVF